MTFKFKQYFEKLSVPIRDGGSIAVWRTEATGTPIVLLHGFPENHRSWYAVLSQLDLEALLPSFQFIVYDLRGFGDSSKTGEASLERFYQDHQEVLAFLNIHRYHLVGHDWGGALALHEACFHPERLLSLIVLNTNYWKTDIFGMWHLTYLNIPILPKLIYKFLPKQFMRLGFLKAFKHPERMNLEVLQSYERMFRDTATTNYWIKLYRNMAKKLLLTAMPLLKTLTSVKTTVLPKKSSRAYQVPVFLIWGEQDTFNPLWIGRDIQAQLQKRGAQIQFHIVADAGHFVQEDQPQEVAKHLLSAWNSIQIK